MFPTNYYKRYSLQSNLDINFNREFKAQVNMGFRNGDKHAPGGGLPSSIMNSVANISPLAPVHMPNGAYGATSTGLNPLASISDKSGYQYTSDNYLTANTRITWEPTSIKGFSAYTNLYIEKRFTRGKVYNVPVPTYNVDATSPTGYKQVGGAGKPSLTDNTSDLTMYNADFGLTYNKQLKKHSIEALALYTVSQTKSNSNTDTRLNLVAPGLDILNLGATLNETTTGTRGQAGRAGGAGWAGTAGRR